MFRDQLLGQVLGAMVVSVLCILSAPAEASKELSMQPLEFNWKIPAKAHVTRTKTENGLTTTVEFDLHATAIPDSKDVLISFHNHKVTDIQGLNPKAPASLRALVLTLDMIELMPSLKVSKDGYLKQIDGIRNTLETLLNSPILANDDAAKARLKQILDTPQMMFNLRDRAGDLWQYWVAQWIGFKNQVGENYRYDKTMEYYGTAVSHDIKITQLGGSEDKPNAIRFHFRADADDEMIRKAAINFYDRMGEVNGGQGNLPKPEEVKAVSFVRIVDATLVGNMLRPDVVESEKSISKSFEFGLTEKEYEKVVYQFKWIE